MKRIRRRTITTYCLRFRLSRKLLVLLLLITLIQAKFEEGIPKTGKKPLELSVLPESNTSTSERFYICHRADPMLIPRYQNKRKLNRFKETAKTSLKFRKSLITYFYVDILGVADYSLYQCFLQLNKNDAVLATNEIRNHLAFIFYGVKRIYLETVFGSLNPFKLVVSLVRIVIFEESSQSCLYGIREGESLDEVDVDKGMRCLDIFSSKQKVGHFDHITLFTAYDLVAYEKIAGTEKNQKTTTSIGVAYRSKICDGKKSLSMIEEKFSEMTTLTVAHELGHSLGAVHDGDNSCSVADMYLMQPGTIYHESNLISNSWLFSECSNKEIAFGISLKNKTQSGRSCLRNRMPIHESVPDVSTRFQGSEIAQNTQCVRKFGSEMCVPADDSLQNTCTDLYCEKSSTHCQVMIPYRGTKCGHCKVCEAGHCREIHELLNISSFDCGSRSSCRLHYNGWSVVIVVLVNVLTFAV